MTVLEVQDAREGRVILTAELYLHPVVVDFLLEFQCQRAVSHVQTQPNVQLQDELKPVSAPVLEARIPSSLCSAACGLHFWNDLHRKEFPATSKASLVPQATTLDSWKTILPASQIAKTEGVPRLPVTLRAGHQVAHLELGCLKQLLCDLCPVVKSGAALFHPAQVQAQSHDERRHTRSHV